LKREHIKVLLKYLILWNPCFVNSKITYQIYTKYLTLSKDFRYTDIIGKKINNKEYKIIKQNSRKKVLYLLIVSTDKEGLYNVQNKSENFTEITYQFNSIKN
ncbi:hypothetical protein NGA79_09685, partial [Lactococcus garvieae]